MKELNHENKLIREAYGRMGTEIIRHEIDQLKENKNETIRRMKKKLSGTQLYHNNLKSILQRWYVRY